MSRLRLINMFKKDRKGSPSNLPTSHGEAVDDELSASGSQLSIGPSPETSASQHTRPTDKIGLFELGKGTHDDEKLIDVVAVHGLQGDSYQTWTHENGTMWLESILAANIPFARVLTFGYDSMVAFSSSAAKLEDKAIELINRLSRKRSTVKNGSTRPIVFVCHSLGGIIVKKALILAHERSSDIYYRDLLENTKAIAFLGVPHRGADAAWWFKFAASSLKGATLGATTHSALVKDLEKASPALATISRQFVERGKSLVIYTFYETRKLSGIVVVDEQSAILNLPNEKLFPVDANHRTICKIPSGESQEFEAVGAWIEVLIRSAATTTPSNPPHGQPYFEVPNRRVSHFVGREDIISRIDQAFTVDPGPHIAVLRGMGGQGKSQIALEYCHRKKDGPFPDTFWVDSTSENTVTSTLVTISDLIETATDQLVDNNARIAFVRRRFASWPTRLLLIFDNYDDPHGFSSIREFFPPNKLCSILVTGRHADIGTLVLGQDANFIELSGLEDANAVKLLEHHSQVKETDSRFGEAIVKRLGYHPLAIVQAGTYIRKGGAPLKEFMEVYKQEKEEILKNTPLISEYRRKLGDEEGETSLNVFTTWQLSFRQLLLHKAEESSEVKLLRLLAFFDSKDISEWLLAEFYSHQLDNMTAELLRWLGNFTDHQEHWSKHLFKKSLIILHDFCLLQSVTLPDSEGYSHASLHPLVKDWIQLQMGKSACQQYALMSTEILKIILSASYQNAHFKLPLQTKQYISLHIIAQEDAHNEYLGSSCTELHQDFQIKYSNGQGWFGVFFRDLGLYEKAEHAQVRAIKTEKELLGNEHPDTLACMHNLAHTYINQGRWKEAEPLQVQVLEIMKRVRGAEHPDTLMSMHNLACTYSNQARFEDAEPLQVQVVEMRKRVLGAERPDTLMSMANLATLYNDQNRWQEAESLGVQVLEIKRSVFGAEHPETLAGMHNLASTWKGLRRYPEAVNLMEECVQLRSRILGAEHPNALKSNGVLASLYRDENRWEEAEVLEVQVLEMMTRTLGAENPETLTSMHNLAVTWKKLDRHLDADKLMEECYQLKRRIFGADHPRTLSSRKELSLWHGEKLNIDAE